MGKEMINDMEGRMLYVELTDKCETLMLDIKEFLEHAHPDKYDRCASTNSMQKCLNQLEDVNDLFVEYRDGDIELRRLEELIRRGVY